MRESAGAAPLGPSDPAEYGLLGSARDWRGPAVILNPGQGRIDSDHYLPVTPETSRWGWWPNRQTAPVMSVDSGTVVTVDTLSHEGILEDQGRDPAAFFGARGIDRFGVLEDAVEMARYVPHTFGVDGPHVVTGPINLRGAEPGDLLQVDVLGFALRVPYGVTSNRHGLGALPGEMPDGDEPPDTLTPGTEHGTVSVFTEVEGDAERGTAVLRYGTDSMVRYPIAPFLGMMGVAPDVDEPVATRPPGRHGGNIDIKHLVQGATLYLPVQVPGAGFAVGDPHFAQGNGEVALTALEGSLRADLRLSVLCGPEARRACGLIENPFGETDDHWIAVGLHADLDEAMREAAREALRFCESRLGLPRHIAYAYLSCAADFEVTQVVNEVKGVHCLIAKRDFM
ncbi:MAG: acetamidase [Acidimicrobiaceae bacterium]|nr:acetamidase [Acidimicrobiaceae bacterium]MXY09747.1 acetamidase [Acidimicrobiaceae bacterium]MXZ65874.1 acetamidase [Acidimicrobiaceae bacterium]MYF32116.1 acetamidase [Acidimicrobiaceae bacterium]MYG79036.1 acetamidase [Acidimicrobiaceae bacterium]